ncbi:phospholipid phosphatase-related protein type 3a isoform X1 [Scyliorhinus canicula]|uniref:phospholipid phosphatase-related protein type 3a isoform X1 n=2 Tax=Scyliorhinus canicula TaxID=7830 RepID=UPI0018F7AA6D|nr:phospholipid phosphatase-related protein type 3a isoform X1 [Scyliorhinus canicula]XP_038633252.1 phospholipid phosphatase-related protein type 3a isoform X1 [Scyliorhinus canicula]
MISAKEMQKKKLSKDSMTLLPCFYFVELPIVASSIVTLYFLELTDLFRPAKVGFQCYDRALSMPYVESSEELIPLLMLLSLAFAGPAASIMIGEGIVYCCQSKLKNKAGSEGSINAGGCNFNSFLRRTVRFVGVHVFGLCATALVTDIIQLATGYHAPFFLTVCKPNYTLHGISCDNNPYITKDICSGSDHHAIVSARKSFPSQHATISAFAAVYISMYFNSTISDCTKLLKPMLVFAFAIAAGICGLTQITQYRSHPVDVYVGFIFGAGIAAYLGFHAVGNFKASEDASPAKPPPKGGLRPLTHLRHDSVYQQSKSLSTDELNPQPRLDGLDHHLAQREKNSLNSLKRASVDVELLAPRSPMGKENMVTFSNTLPRVNTPNLDEAARRHMTIHVSMDASRSKQLISQWKQKSIDGMCLDHDPTISQSQPQMRTALELRGVGFDQDEPAPSSLYPTVQARNSERGSGARVLIQSRPGPSQLVHIPEETQGSVSTSPKSNSARAKWMLMAEKGGVPRPNNQPRIMQVIAMSKQQSMITVTPKHSDGSSSSESSHYKSPSERDSSSIVTVDAHGSHPIVHVSSGNGGVGPWEWKSPQGSADIHDAFELNDLNRDYRSYRSAKNSGISPASSASDLEQEDTRFCSVATINVAGAERSDTNSETLTITSSRDSTLRRKPNPVFLGEREASTDTDQDAYFKKLQANRRFKD